MTQFDCDLQQHGTPLAHVWSHTIGSGRAHLALRADWQAQMRKAHAELGCRHVRFHAILSDGMGTVLIEQGEVWVRASDDTCAHIDPNRVATDTPSRPWIQTIAATQQGGTL